MQAPLKLRLDETCILGFPRYPASPFGLCPPIFRAKRDVIFGRATAEYIEIRSTMLNHQGLAPLVQAERFLVFADAGKRIRTPAHAVILYLPASLAADLQIIRLSKEKPDFHPLKLRSSDGADEAAVLSLNHIHGIWGALFRNYLGKTDKLPDLELMYACCLAAQRLNQQPVDKLLQAVQFHLKDRFHDVLRRAQQFQERYLTPPPLI